MSWIYRSSVAISWGALIASGAAYTGMRAKFGWLEPTPSYDATGEEITIKKVQMTFSEHLMVDAVAFLAIGTVVFVAKHLPSAIWKMEAKPLSECKALTFAKEIKQQLKIRYPIEFGETKEIHSEAAYVSDFPRIETPIVILHSSSPKHAVAHELIHVHRKHLLSKYLFTSSLIPPSVALIEHSGGIPMLILIPIISTAVLNKLFRQYCEQESDLMACDLVSDKDIEEGIESFRSAKKTGRGLNYSLIDTHPPLDYRINLLLKELENRKSCDSRVIESPKL